MASWVSVQLDTTPPVLAVDVPPGRDPGTTPDRPVHDERGSDHGWPDSAHTTTVTGTRLRLTMPLRSACRCLRLRDIIFTATDDGPDNQIRSPSSRSDVPGIPSPVTHLPAGPLAPQRPELSSVVDLRVHSDCPSPSNNTGSIVDETITTAISERDRYRSRRNESVHTAEIHEITHG